MQQHKLENNNVEKRFFLKEPSISVLNTMKSSYIYAVFHAVAVGFSTSSSVSANSDHDVVSTASSLVIEEQFFEAEFLTWSVAFNASYENAEERHNRLQIWLDNHGKYLYYVLLLNVSLEVVFSSQ